MHDLLSDSLGAFCRAWEKVFNFPLPEKMRKTAGTKGKTLESAVFVLIAWLCGLLAVLAGNLFLVLFSRFAGALIFAVLGWIFLLFHDRGRGDGTIAAWMVRHLPGEYIQLNLVLPVVVTMVKFALLMKLFYAGSGSLFALMLAGSFALEALLFQELGVLNDSGNSVRNFLVTVLFILLLGILKSLLISSLSALVFAIMWKFSEKLFRKNSVTIGDIRSYSSFCFWLMLLVATLVL